MGAVPKNSHVTYAYDAPVYDAPGNESAQERGPPGIALARTIYDAVGLRSNGTSARPDGLKPRSIATYAHPGVLAQPVADTTMTAGHVVLADGEFSSVPAGQGAAKTASEVKPNATVRDLLKIEPGNAREPPKSGLASRRSDSELLDSVLRPRDGTYMTVSRDGALLEGNHRRFELLDRAANPQSRIDWETPIFLDGWLW